MSNSCVWIPDAPNGKSSKLFTDLMSHLGNRDMAKAAWGFTQTDLFKAEFSDLRKDANGEVTYEALAEVLNLDSMIDQGKKDENLAMDMGLITRFGKPRTFDTAKVAMDRANEFNGKSKYRVAVVENAGDKYQTRIVQNTPLSVSRADINKARGTLNETLLNLLQGMGFNVEFSNDPSFNGIFNPLMAEQNAKNLRTVIRIKNGEEGLDKLPEEVCHLILAGMKNDPLKQRLDAVFTEDVVKAVLGDRYQKYAERYRNSIMPLADRLRDEAEGQALAALLKGKPLQLKVRRSVPLLQRIWEAFLEMIGVLKEEDIDNAYISAHNALLPVQEKILDGSIDTVVDAKMVMESEVFYDLAAEASKMAEVAMQGEALLSQQLAVLRRTQADKDTKLLEARIKQVRKNLEAQHYTAAASLILDAIGRDIAEIVDEVAGMGRLYNTSTDMNVISGEAGLVNRIKASVNGYMNYLDMLIDLPKLNARGEIQMDENDARQLSAQALNFRNNLDSLRRDTGRMTFSVLKQFLLLFYGDNGAKPESFKESDKVKWESIDLVLSSAKKDISWWDGNIFSAGDSNNPLLNLIHAVVAKQQAKRDNRINKLTMRLQDKEAKLHAAGYSNDFVYQRDENGIPTGFYVGPSDWTKFEKAYNEFEASLDYNTMSVYEILTLREAWEKRNLTEIEVGPEVNGQRRKEMIPNPELYGTGDFQKGWSDVQKEYYNTLLEMKAELDSDLPPSERNLYLAPQVRRSVTQMFDKDGRGALKTVWNHWKQEYAAVEDNTDYNTSMLFGFDNKPIKVVPVYFTHKMDDPRDMSTDAGRAMFNYITMAVNYSEMGKIANAMRLMQDYMRTTEGDYKYEVQQTRGGKKIMSVFESLGQKYFAYYKKSGEGTNISKAIIGFIDRTVFNDTKNPVSIRISENKSLKLDPLLNLFQRMTSVSRIGLNPLSGMTNVLQGEHQINAEAATGRYFDGKNVLWAKGEYMKLLPQYMGDFNSIDRHDRMYMLINQFNATEDFFRDMKDKNFNKSALKRVMGRGNVYFMNTMGEHYLHVMGSLMVLDNAKVIRAHDKERKEVSLYDVIQNVHDDNGWHLELDDDIEFVKPKEDGKEVNPAAHYAYLQGILKGEDRIVKKTDRDQLFVNLAVYINHLNDGMHGGYSEIEKGNMNRFFLGRMIMQFRQWMPGMIKKLFGKEHYDAIMGEKVSGGYNVVWKWITATLHDMKSMSLKMALNNNHLTDKERKQARLAYFQTGATLLLMLMAGLTAGWKDKDEFNIRLLAYAIKRLEMEVGAMAAFPPYGFVKNAFTLIQSPAAGIETLKSLSQLLDIFSIADEMNSGRFKGWNKYLKTMYQLTPVYNVQKLIDMKDYNYMFNIFK